MAKNLGQIITDARQIINQTDSANSQFSDGQIRIWVNDAYRKIVIALRHLPITDNDYTVSSQTISLNSNTITVDQAKLKNPDNSNKYESLEIINLDQLLQMDPDYENATTNFPKYLCRVDVTSVVLYPPPKSSVTALTTPLRTYGLELPSELTSSTDTPNLPENLHDILSHWAAHRCFTVLNDEPRSTQQLTLFRGALKDHREVSTEFSRHLKRFRWEESL